MSGVTFTVTGSSNDTNLVLSSENAAIHESGHHDEHDHLLRSDINRLRDNIVDISSAVVALRAKDVLLTGNIVDISLAVVALKAKDVLVDASITSLVAKDVVLTGNIVDISSAVVALKAKDVSIDASINNAKNNILDLQNNDALEMSYSAASASIAQYIAKTVTIPLANLCTISGDVATEFYHLPPVWNIGVVDRINQFPSLHYSHVYPHIGDEISDSKDPYITVAYPKNYNPLKKYPTLLYIEDVSGMYVGAAKYLQDSSGFMDAFKGTDLSDGFFIVGIGANSSFTSPMPIYPFVPANGRNIVLSGIGYNTPQPEDDLISYNLMNMIRIELIPFLKQKYTSMKLDRDSLIISGKSNSGYFAMRTMLLFPEIAKRWIANNPFICVSKVLPTIGNVQTFPYVTGFKIVTLENGKQEIKYEVDEVVHRKHLSFVRDNAKRIAGMGLDIQLVNFNNFGSTKNLYDNCGNTLGSTESSGFTNIGVESCCGGFTYFALPALLDAGFSSAPVLDHELGIAGDRLIGKQLKVFTTESSKSFSDHTNVSGWDNLHEILCKLYAVPDASFSHVKYLNTITLSDKRDFKAHYLTTQVDASFNLSVTFNQNNTRMWKTRYTLVNGYADGSNAVFDSMQRFTGNPSVFSTTTLGKNNRDQLVFKLLPSDPSGKILKVELLNKDNVAIGTTTTVVTKNYAFTSRYYDSSGVWLAYDASLNYTPNLTLINALQ